MEIADFNKMQGTNQDNLATKIFKDTYCNKCEYESTPIKETDAMGRETFWQDLGRPDIDSSCLCGNKVCNC